MIGFLSMNHPVPSARHSGRDLGDDAALGKPVSAVIALTAADCDGQDSVFWRNPHA